VNAELNTNNNFNTIFTIKERCKGSKLAARPLKRTIWHEMSGFVHGDNVIILIPEFQSAFRIPNSTFQIQNSKFSIPNIFALNEIRHIKRNPYSQR
jgi:hypothetical protein